MPGTIAGLPFWEVVFDADGDADEQAVRTFVEEVRDAGITDLIVFSHGWNNDRSVATRLYTRFFADVPDLLRGAGGSAAAKVGVVGVFWPSMRWTDEPIPDFPDAEGGAAGFDDAAGGAVGGAGGEAVGGAGGEASAPAGVEGSGLPPDTVAALEHVFRGKRVAIEGLAEMLADQPDAPEDRAAFLDGLRELAGLGEGERPAADDPDDADDPQVPAMLAVDDPDELFETFAARLDEIGAGVEASGGAAGFGNPLARLWNGAREALRQLTYYSMKKRAGTVGKEGLGPVLGRLHEMVPDVRVHLVGHSFGARLVSYALAGLPDGARPVKSLTLLQGAFSHFAFADALPHAPTRSGGLKGMAARVDGPIVVCHSRHDSAVGTMYPLASLASGDDSAAFEEQAFRFGAMGHDGAQAVGAAEVDIASAGFAYPFGAGSFTNVDASEVVKNGRPPSGAHSDICHPEVAWVVLRAAGFGG